MIKFSVRFLLYSTFIWVLVHGGLQVPYAVQAERTFCKLEMGKTRLKRIVQGTSADSEMASYHATISTRFGDGLCKFCGGNIISRYYILTAAHCIYRASKIAIVWNGPYEGRSSEPVFVTPFNITDVKIPIEYDPKSLLYDLGLIKMAFPFQFTDSIRPIGLPQLRDVGKSFDFLTGQLCGMGSEISCVYELGLGSEFVKCTNVTVSSVACLFYGFPMPSSMLCVRGGWTRNSGQGSLGDSGGGLVINGILIGLFIGSFIESQPFGPAIYINVAHHLHWIVSHSDVMSEVEH